jgi:hypothetical protein
MPTDLLSTDEVLVEYPILTRRHLQTLRASGVLPFYLVRRRAVYNRMDLDSYIASCRTVRPTQPQQAKS